MEPTYSCRETLIVSGVLFLATIYVGAFYLWIALSVWRTPAHRTAEHWLDDIELAVRNPEIARTELPRDRQLGNSATSLLGNVATP
jgi:hypothetical protein